MTSTVSIVLPLGCGADPALRCLEALAAQPAEPAFDVIVLADGAPWLEPLLSQLDGDVTVAFPRERTVRPGADDRRRLARRGDRDLPG